MTICKCEPRLVVVVNWCEMAVLERWCACCKGENHYLLSTPVNLMVSRMHSLSDVRESTGDSICSLSKIDHSR